MRVRFLIETFSFSADFRFQWFSLATSVPNPARVQTLRACGSRLASASGLARQYFLVTHSCPVTGSSSASAKSSSSVLNFCAAAVDARKRAKKKSDFQADIFTLLLSSSVLIPAE